MISKNVLAGAQIGGPSPSSESLPQSVDEIELGARGGRPVHVEAAVRRDAHPDSPDRFVQRQLLPQALLAGLEIERGRPSAAVLGD